MPFFDFPLNPNNLPSQISGSSSIVTVGTIATGIWHGTAIAPTYGGTGADLHAAASGNLPQFGASGVLADSGSSLSQIKLLGIGPAPTDTYSSAMAIDATYSYHAFQCVHATSATSTLTPSAAGTRQLLILRILGDATSGTCVLTFASTFRSAGTLSVTATTAWQICFVSDATNWVELCRTGALT